jgi:UDP-N-acetylmuramoyl-L-alanyl-D-glutamate--2,6-diaminopimelate ligase
MSLKENIKKFVPSAVWRPMLNPYHWLESLVANIRYGFPSRGMKVVMVTGTNGKTTTAAFLANILKTAGYTVGLCSTAYFEVAGERIANDLNFTVTNPFKLQALFAEMRKAKVDHLVLEVTSHAIQQHRIWGIPCDVAVITNLTQDHLDYHGTMEAYAGVKGKLFARQPRLMVLNRDDEWFDFFNKYKAGEQKMNYGTDEQAECRIIGAKLHRRGSEVKLRIDHQTELQFAIQMPGKFNVYNATAAAATAYLMHVDIQKIEQGIEQLEGIPGRLEYISTTQPFDVVVDYAHTPDAFKNVLETMRHLTKNRIILVFGATGDRDKGKRPIMGKLASELADRIILTDEETYTEDPATIRKMISDGIKDAGGDAKTEDIPDRKAAIEKALSLARRGDTVLVTGMGHEQYRVLDGKRVPWNEIEIVRGLLEG